MAFVVCHRCTLNTTDGRHGDGDWGSADGIERRHSTNEDTRRRTYPHKHTHAHAHTHAHTPAHTHARAQTHTHAHARTRTHTHAHARTHVLGRCRYRVESAAQHHGVVAVVDVELRRTQNIHFWLWFAWGGCECCGAGVLLSLLLWWWWLFFAVVVSGGDGVGGGDVVDRAWV